MKLAILGTRGIPACYGGFETFAQELSIRLVEHGIDVTVYCEKMEGESPESYKGVWLSYIPAPKMGPFTTILFDLRCLWHARKGFDVVYMLGYGTSIFCLIARLYGAKVWINMDGIEWARAKWNFAGKIYFKIMEAIAVRIANRIIADAEGIKQFLQDRHKHISPCSVIPYGANVVDSAPDISLFSGLNLQPNQYYLIVCRLEPENYVLEIIKGFAAAESKLPLVVVGNNKTDTPYIKMLKAVNDRHIMFIGVVYDKAKLWALRYYCKAYFHGHSVGGTNPSLLEALGCGNIVIAHDNLFNREVVGESGLYFKTADEIPSLISLVENMDDKQRADVSNKARQIIKERYNWDIVTDMYLKTLKEQ